MKHLLFIICLIVTVSVSAQNKVELSVGDFHTLKVYDLIQMNLIQSNENKIVITGEKAKDVQIINKNGTLKIRMKLTGSFKGSNTLVTLYFKNIKIIDANEGAAVTCENSIETEALELKTQEGANINLIVNTGNLKAKAVTGGVIELTGSAEKQTISLNTGGAFKGRTFQTENTYLKVRAAGQAEIKASELADVKIIAGGSAYIYGVPNTLKKKLTLGGKIELMDSNLE